jgi:hypothetical protein
MTAVEIDGGVTSGVLLVAMLGVFAVALMLAIGFFVTGLVQSRLRKAPDPDVPVPADLDDEKATT